MLSGKPLGLAIKEAMRLKGVTQKAVADKFGIKQPSVSSWTRTGRVDKEHLDDLFDYFSDVVGPTHWGIRSRALNYKEVIDVAARIVEDERSTDGQPAQMSPEALSIAKRLDRLGGDARAMALEMIEVMLSRLGGPSETKLLESKKRKPKSGPDR